MSSSARARRLETELDAKLAQVSRADGSAAGSSFSSATTKQLFHEIEALLIALGEVNDTMSREASAATGGTATMMHKLQRHREILHDFQQEFTRSKQNLQAATERTQLLSSVREDIREHRDSRQSDALLRERNAIGASSRAADDVLGQAAATRDSLNAQRGGFSGMAGKLSTIASLAPQIDALMGMIQRRQKRDKLVLGVVFGVCTAALLFYGLG